MSADADATGNLIAALQGTILSLEERNEELARKLESLQHAVEEGAEAFQQAQDELRHAHEQLIQQEKLASLGQLTAGIAHEIKNPLNFVNNFAELSVDLVHELKEALEAGEDVDDILADLEQNARQIAKHGARADSIARSMMQHASGGSGEHQPADLNELVEEFVGLAYHGMRAQRPDFNVALECQYGEDVGSILMMREEIGRVLLNLLNNAFQAICEKADCEGESYSPVVRVSTRKVGDRVEIRVADNGPGIPAEVRGRIFEAFYTTKPAGQGTGLGLSMSHEIVTRGHGGTLLVEDSGEGATFLISLPVR